MAGRLAVGGDPLNAFLQLLGDRRFGYGALDCGLWLADWVYAYQSERADAVFESAAANGVRAGGAVRDPAAHLRGRYSDAAGAQAILGRHGLPVTVARLARAAGLKRNRAAPRRGDIGVLDVKGQGPTGAIFWGGYDRNWLVLTSTGVTALKNDGRFRLIAMWAVMDA